MKKRIIENLKLSRQILALMLFLVAPAAMYGSKVPKEMHGFKLIEKRFVKEVNADCYYFIHEKSGARLLKIAASDPNKTFSISFHTLPNSDCGTPHILEHSVLNGSTNFPVKSPMDIIQKSSLKTFINAFTGKDATTYPLASMNEKDYFNLMNMYLDAVLYPRIYDEEKIFKQEAWHYELTDKAAPIVYKGVVHGEMKGAFSSPSRYLNYNIYKNLMPNTSYGFESGGYPYAIPNLTWEDFKNFHKKYYHPENSYIVLYGDADLDKELSFINDKYLSKFQKSGNNILAEDQTPFTAMKDVKEYYPVMEGANTDKQTFLSLSFVYGSGSDDKLSLALDMITSVLVNREAAPIRLALQEAGIGKNVSSSVSSYKQNIIQINVQNANPADKDKFYEIVMSILKESVKNGVDKKAVESTLNSYEFQMREGDNAQKGMGYVFQVINSFIFTKNPFTALEYEKPLAELKAGIKANYLEDLVSKAFINNPHTLLLTVEPKPDLDKELNAKVAEDLKKYKESLSEQKLDELIKGTNDLIAYQKREDTPEALATIPMLSLSDINPKAQFFAANAKKAEGVDILHREEFTNKIVYANLYFDLRVIPQELIPYASLLSEVLTSMNTEKYSFGDLNMEINYHTGGINTYLSRYLENNDDSKMIPKFVVSMKATNEKLDKLFELSTEILNKTKYNDPERLKAILIRHQSRLDAQIKGDGSNMANTRFKSYISNTGMFDEQTSGYDYYSFISKLTKDFDSNQQQIIDNLTKVASLLITKENMIVGTTCNSDDYKLFTQKLKLLTSNIKSEKPSYNSWNFTLDNKKEGFQTASKVQYVYGGANFKKLGYSWSGKMLVLNKIISQDWLHKQLRVIGGAYGGRSTFSTSGNITFYSYRDPNLAETVANYKKTSEFLKNFNASEKEMVPYIISTISGIDQPTTPSQRGEISYYNYFIKAKAEDTQKERDEILKTTKNDIVGYAKMINDIIEQGVICVYGNSEKIDANKDLFKNFVKIE